MLSNLSFSGLSALERQNLLACWSHQWHRQYFLAVAWQTQRHLDTVIRRGEALAFRRTSGAIHFVDGDFSFIEELLEIGPVLLHEEALLHATKGKDLGPDIHIEETSLLMQRSPNTGAGCAAVMCDQLNLSAAVERYERIDLQKVDLIKEIHPLYKRFMKGSLSLSDFIAVYQQGAYGVAIYDQGQPVAIGHIGFLNQKEAFVFGILVIPDYRGRGYGRAIMEALHHEADSRKWTLGLLTDNPVAVSLYTSVGYRMAGKMLRLKA